MSKTIIAIDIDDVLAVHAKSFVEYSNKIWNTNLKVDDYLEHWADMWGIDQRETELRAKEYHASGHIGKYPHKTEAVPVLQKLAHNYSLRILTSRRQSVQKETLEWVEKHYNGIFDGVYFAGIWDKFSKDRHLLTKVDMCQEIGAEFLIDDQLKHVLGTAERGIESVLFGDYPWNHSNSLANSVVRCKDWTEVGAYFDRIKLQR